MKIIKYLLIIIFFSSCSQIENYKEVKAIEIVQKAKFGQHNLAKFGLLGLLINSNNTNLDMANMLADQDPNKEYKWIAKKVDNNNNYDVCFCEFEDVKGFTWGVNLETKITKFTTSLKE